MKVEAKGQERVNILETTITIYTSTERSEHFLKLKTFLTCSLMFLRSKTSDQFKQEKINQDSETYRER